MNNRNLKTLECDVKVSKQLAPFLKGNDVFVSESGLGKRETLLSLYQKGFKSFLVGSYLMKCESQVQVHTLLGDGSI